jgi:single-stranded-DNA-specific exonuclease
MTAPSPTARPRIARSPRWSQPTTSAGSALESLGEALRLPPVICSLLAARGYENPEDAKQFLRPRLEQLHPSERMHGMDAAVARLAQAARGGEVVLVHGDYDVDGICSTTIMVKVLRELGAGAFAAAVTFVLVLLLARLYALRKDALQWQ